jgi:HPt (histidine-containing phosphotransfer) domain-containing protein
MSRRTDDTASVATFADHEIITPPHKLRKAIAAAEEGDDPVARAEAALADLSSEFSTWMEAECVRLETARQNVKNEGFTKKTHEVLFRAAHDIKGEAGTFGYPAIAGVANSLCRLIEHTPDRAQIPLGLVDQHVDAIRAILREYVRTDLLEVADRLTKRLREVTDEFLIKENSFRPDYLELILAPSVVPGT